MRSRRAAWVARGPISSITIRRVRRASQPFTGHYIGIMAGGADQIGCAPAEVLVKLESHAALSVGTGMTRSRATSAPYAIAAKTS